MPEPQSAKRIGDKQVPPAPIVFVSSRPGRKIAVMEKFPPTSIITMQGIRGSPVAPRTGLLLSCHKTVILPTRELSIVWLNLMHYTLAGARQSVRAFALTQQSLHLANPACVRGSFRPPNKIGLSRRLSVGHAMR